MRDLTEDEWLFVITTMPYDVDFPFRIWYRNGYTIVWRGTGLNAWAWPALVWIDDVRRRLSQSAN